MNDLKFVTAEYYERWVDEFILVSNITDRSGTIRALAYIIRLSVDDKISIDQLKYASRKVAEELVRKGITRI